MQQQSLLAIQPGSFVPVPPVADTTGAFVPTLCKHSSLGYKSPLQFEINYYLKLASQL
jgi:hypothetical protein